MTYRSRRRVLAYGNDHTLLNALLLLVCAAMTALGAGALGILCFLPAVVVSEHVLCWFEDHHHKNEGDDERSGGSAHGASHSATHTTTLRSH